MPRRTVSIAAALSVLMIGATLIAGCGTQNNDTEVVCNTAEDLSSEDALALNEEIAELTKSIEINSKDAVAFYNRANAKYNSKDCQKSIADYNSAIEINAQYDDAYYNRGRAKYKLKDYLGAVADYDKAIIINSEFALAYNNRGVVRYLKIGDDESACTDFKKSASLGNEFRVNWLNSEEGKWCRNMR